MNILSVDQDLKCSLESVGVPGRSFMIGSRRPTADDEHTYYHKNV